MCYNFHMMTNISDSILIARRRARMTQGEVAEALGLDRITIVRAERKPEMVKPHTLERILSFLTQVPEKNLAQMSQTT
jgi:DNA-binding XRE family transcriptional regulator